MMVRRAGSRCVGHALQSLAQLLLSRVRLLPKQNDDLTGPPLVWCYKIESEQVLDEFMAQRAKSLGRFNFWIPMFVPVTSWLFERHEIGRASQDLGQVLRLDCDTQTRLFGRRLFCSCLILFLV